MRLDGGARAPVRLYTSFRTNQNRIESFTARSMASGLAARVARRVEGHGRRRNIRFALATKDPKGKTTTDIVRTATTRNSFGADDSVKTRSEGGTPGWPAGRYLNLWVCNLGGGLLGYAQFPGGPAKTDGVVIVHSAFGTSGTASAPFDLGRTATHEIGHWLNLRHIWGDENDCSGTDHVSDTPNAQLPNYGSPTFPHLSCDNGPNGDMFMNYMDYVDDAAMFMFTPGQITRMNATLAGPRSKIGR